MIRVHFKEKMNSTTGYKLDKAEKCYQKYFKNPIFYNYYLPTAGVKVQLNNQTCLVLMTIFLSTFFFPPHQRWKYTIKR